MNKSVLSALLTLGLASALNAAPISFDRLAGGFDECGMALRVEPGASMVKPATARPSMAASPAAPIPASAAARSAAIFSRATGDGEAPGSPR